ncbi:hypothetical protein B4907_07685 [Yersinia kristensenii]|nr:hypothetical protein B4907_07685 [Yersinia kristensenii]
MRALIKISLLGTLLLSPLAYAQWGTVVDDDLFTGVKSYLAGDLRGNSSALLFDCTSNTLSISYIEKHTQKESDSVIPLNLIVKVDADEAQKMNAQSGMRNSNYMGITSDDKEKIIPILKSLQQAKNKFLVGVETKDGGHQYSNSGVVAGSTKAVDQFIKACGITL